MPLTGIYEGFSQVDVIVLLPCGILMLSFIALIQAET